MTAPRQILPGKIYLVTRRCAERRLLLRPSATTNEIFRYVLALAARRFNVQVHAFCVLSNHFHAVVTDGDARLPAFCQYLNALVARAINASLGRWEAFWAPSSFSAVALASPVDVIDKAAYVLANPVAAGLVKRGRDWPGLWSAPETIGGAPLLARRPITFFRERGYLPEEVQLELSTPPGFESPDEFRTRLVEVLSDLEERALAELSSQSRKVLGAERVLAQRPTSRPAGAEPRRGLNPRVAARDKWKRIEALARLVEFLDSYRAAWRARRAGQRTAVFPAGTYRLRIEHGVPCAPA
jgi:REP element-mobilizing transposase RayT